jgi:hypothetical protein
MLLTMIEVVSCENLKCRDFALVMPNPHRLRSYYCPLCGKVSSVRVVDANLAESPQRFKAYVLERVQPLEDKRPAPARPQDMKTF